MLTDKQRKYLIELIGECYHSPGHPRGRNEDSYCNKCEMYYSAYEDYELRTFTTPDDFFSVLRALDKDTVDAVIDMWDCSLTIGEIINQPTFIEDFMRGVVRMGEME